MPQPGSAIPFPIALDGSVQPLIAAGIFHFLYIRLAPRSGRGLGAQPPENLVYLVRLEREAIGLLSSRSDTNSMMLHDISSTEAINSRESSNHKMRYD